MPGSKILLESSQILMLPVPTLNVIFVVGSGIVRHALETETSSRQTLVLPIAY
jgi:hypothetical protein